MDSEWLGVSRPVKVFSALSNLMVKSSRNKNVSFENKPNAQKRYDTFILCFHLFLQDNVLLDQFDKFFFAHCVELNKQNKKENENKSGLERGQMSDEYLCR